MTIEEYFGDWTKVIDKIEFSKIMKWLRTQDLTNICPLPKNIFRAFKLCKLNECKVIFLGQDPYPQSGVATGILFGNSADTPEERLSPSLQVIKEAAINYEIPHHLLRFDNTLESWARQGILMINTALTCKTNEIGSHVKIWEPFITKLIENISKYNNGLVFVLFGGQAKTFKSYIKGNHCIIEIEHPAYFARRGMKMPYTIFTDINKYLINQYNMTISFYEEDVEHGGDSVSICMK